MPRLFISSLIGILAFSLLGCVESSFDLAAESRLPKWFEIPKGSSRAEIKITLDYYSRPSGGLAVFKMFDRGHKFFALKKIEANSQTLYPIKLKKTLADNKKYPLYEIVTVDGITEVIEHRKPEPVFYLVDDPEILKELGVQP